PHQTSGASLPHVDPWPLRLCGDPGPCCDPAAVRAHIQEEAVARLGLDLSLPGRLSEVKHANGLALGGGQRQTIPADGRSFEYSSAREGVRGADLHLIARRGPDGPAIETVRAAGDQVGR